MRISAQIVIIVFQNNKLSVTDQSTATVDHLSCRSCVDRLPPTSLDIDAGAELSGAIGDQLGPPRDRPLPFDGRASPCRRSGWRFRSRNGQRSADRRWHFPSLARICLCLWRRCNRRLDRFGSVCRSLSSPAPFCEIGGRRDPDTSARIDGIRGCEPVPLCKQPIVLSVGPCNGVEGIPRLHGVITGMPLQPGTAIADQHRFAGTATEQRGEEQPCHEQSIFHGSLIRGIGNETSAETGFTLQDNRLSMILQHEISNRPNGHRRPAYIIDVAVQPLLHWLAAPFHQ